MSDSKKASQDGEGVIGSVAGNAKVSTLPGIQIQRPALDLEQVQKISGVPDQPENSWKDLLKVAQKIRCRRPKSAKKLFHKYLPITNWAFNYNVKGDLTADIIAGLTVAIMHIPQGMAYASLAETAPIYGIYTAIFPVIIYTLLGPSRHVSMGTNPLTAILVGSAVTKFSKAYDPVNNSTLTFNDHDVFHEASDDVSESNPEFGHEQVIIAVTLLAGLWQLAFALLGLGKLSWILSEVLVSGYTTAAAIHVLASQIKGVFGIPDMGSHNGPLKLYYILEELFTRITETNVASLVIAVICILVLVVNNEFLKPRLAKKCSFPVPIQLIVVVVGTVFSHFFNFQEEFQVPIVGDLPRGFPDPQIPKAGLLVDLLPSSAIIAIVGYCITLSMAKIFATKFYYTVDGNQELFSEGAANVFGCFFMSMPSAASMSRSAVQVGVGGKTQLTSAVSIIVLILVILFAGPLFEELPKAILSAIIVVALKSMLLQFHDLPKFLKRSKLDACLWILTFILVIILDIDLGLWISIALTLIVLVYRSYHVRIKESGAIPDTELFVDISQGEFCVRPTRAVVIKMAGAISFANFEDVFDRLEKKLRNIDDKDKEAVVLDISGVPYMDQSGAKAMQGWLKVSNRRLLAAPNLHVSRMLQGAKVSKDRMFVSVLDALTVKESPPIESFGRPHTSAESAKTGVDGVVNNAFSETEEVPRIVNEHVEESSRKD